MKGQPSTRLRIVPGCCPSVEGGKLCQFPRVPGALAAPCPGCCSPGRAQRGRLSIHQGAAVQRRGAGSSPGHKGTPAARFGDISSAGTSQSTRGCRCPPACPFLELQGARHGGRRRRRRELGGHGGAGAGSAGGGGHTPYLGVTVVIAVVGWRMWQVVMVKVDGVWGRLLTERNTGRDRRQGVRTQVEGTAKGGRDSQS